MTLYIGASGGVLQIVDVPHATDKDVRSLFALDSLKKQRDASIRGDLHAPRISSYYGDITGPAELGVINVAQQRMYKFIEQLPYPTGTGGETITSSSPSSFDMISPSIAMSPSDPSLAIDRSRSIESSKSLVKRSMAQCKTLLLRSVPAILHVSHYSFEWAVNVNGSMFVDSAQQARSRRQGLNHYLVGAYQKTQYDRKMVNEFITMGLTHNIPHREDQFRFFVDDFTEDLLRIQQRTEWVMASGLALPYDIWMVVTQYAVDAILPVQVAVGAQSFARCCCSNGFHGHQKEGHCEVTLDEEGMLHLMVTGVLKEKYRESQGGLLAEWVKAIGRIFFDFGRIVDAAYGPKRFQLKSEYNRWKKESYKKRPKLPSMHSLTERLRQHQLLKHERAEHDVPSLYFVNTNFKIKEPFRRGLSQRCTRSFQTAIASSASNYAVTPRPKAKSSTIHQSIRKLFSFGSSSSASSKATAANTAKNSRSASNSSSSSESKSKSKAAFKSKPRSRGRSNSKAKGAKGSRRRKPTQIEQFTQINANCQLSHVALPPIPPLPPETTKMSVAVSRTRTSIGPAPTMLAVQSQRPNGITKASTVPLPSTTTMVSMSSSGCTAESSPGFSRSHLHQHSRSGNMHSGGSLKRYSLQSYSEEPDDWVPATDINVKRTSCPSTTYAAPRVAATVKYSKRLKTRYSQPPNGYNPTLKMTGQNSNHSSQSRDSLNYNDVDRGDDVNNEPVLGLTLKLLPSRSGLNNANSNSGYGAAKRGRFSISSSCSDTPKSYYLRQEHLLSIRNRRVHSTPRVEEEPDEAEQIGWSQEQRTIAEDSLNVKVSCITAEEVEAALDLGCDEQQEVLTAPEETTETATVEEADEYTLGTVTLDIIFSSISDAEDSRVADLRIDAAD